jgi:hypothetical protein
MAIDEAALGDNIQVTIRLMLDGAVLVARKYDVEMRRFSSTEHWSFTVATPITAGTHNVSVQALFGTMGRTGTGLPSAIVAGAADPLTQGTLTAVVVNR